MNAAAGDVEQRLIRKEKTRKSKQVIDKVSWQKIYSDEPIYQSVTFLTH